VAGEVGTPARPLQSGGLDGRLLAMRIARPSGVLFAEAVVYLSHATPATLPPHKIATIPV
jgi:hypothetical protein